ncbi:DedA family protein [Candidatus Gracilibacteria bacterium]|nr:DedA family protein [Candidatus Gracilibacteria bacterium]
MEQFASALLDITSGMGYWGIVILMAIESSFIPFPSEIVIPPAAYLAYKGEMNIYLIILCGILGSLIGAVFNYYVAMWLGKPLAYKLVDKKWAKYLLLSRSGLEKAENYFNKYGSASTFFGRLIPAVRQLISLPAGFVKMDFGKFVFYTVLGSGFWVSVLAALGYFFGENQALLKEYYREITIGLIVLVALIVAVVLLKKLIASRRVSIE